MLKILLLFIALAWLGHMAYRLMGKMSVALGASPRTPSSRSRRVSAVRKRAEYWGTMLFWGASIIIFTAILLLAGRSVLRAFSGE